MLLLRYNHRINLIRRLERVVTTTNTSKTWDPGKVHVPSLTVCVCSPLPGPTPYPNDQNKPNGSRGVEEEYKYSDRKWDLGVLPGGSNFGPLPSSSYTIDEDPIIGGKESLVVSLLVSERHPKSICCFPLEF